MTHGAHDDDHNTNSIKRSLKMLAGGGGGYSFPFHRDAHHHYRGPCNSCQGPLDRCPAFVSASNRVLCDYCGCPPVRHRRIEPEDEDDYVTVDEEAEDAGESKMIPRRRRRKPSSRSLRAEGSSDFDEADDAAFVVKGRRGYAVVGSGKKRKISAGSLKHQPLR